MSHDISNERIDHPSRTQATVLFAITIAALFWSGWEPVDRLTWFMEVVWVLLALPLMLYGVPRFPLTKLLSVLLLLHALILMYGGHYTYAQTPLGLWFREAFELSRNHYDRLGHLAQGFVPAILVRELLLRRSPLQRGGWLLLLTTSVCLAFSALFELIEWWAALLYGAAADAFLATQGDIWDTQWDMFLALCGALLAQVLLGRWHDRQMGLSPRR